VLPDPPVFISVGVPIWGPTMHNPPSLLSLASSAARQPSFTEGSGPKLALGPSWMQRMEARDWKFPVSAGALLSREGVLPSQQTRRRRCQKPQAQDQKVKLEVHPIRIRLQSE